MFRKRLGWGMAAALALASPLPAALAQDTPTAQTLFVLTGNRANDRVGAVVGTAGDLDGDGRPELAVGTPNLITVYAGTLTGPLFEIRAERPGDFEGVTLHPLPDINGDGRSDLALAAPRADLDNAPDAGALYLISGANGERLRAYTGLGANGHFGASFAVIADVTGDNRPDFVVGAPGERNGAGVVALLSPTSNNRLLSRLGNSGERFGTAIVSLGDLNGDRRPDIAVGAPLANVGGRQANGRVVIFTPSTGQILVNPLFGAESNTNLGAALATGVDLDGDGRSELLIGAPARAGAAGPGAGVVFVYSIARPNVLLRLEGAAAGDGFGSLIVAGGDFDGDGRADFAVGAPLADVEGRTDAGLVQIFSGATGQPLLTRAGFSPGDQFGAALAWVGDVTGDRRAELLVGAPLADVFDVPDAGAARLISLPGPPAEPGSDGGGGGGGGGL